MKYTTGTIIKTTAKHFEILSEEGEILLSNARGVFRHRGISPLPGDRVQVSIELDQTVIISEIFPRKNQFLRPAMSNLDALLIVVAASNPVPVLLFLDQMLAIAEYSGVQIALIVTKDDLNHDSADQLIETYRRVGYPVFLNDIYHSGVEKICEYIKNSCRGMTVAFAGSSGVGKSTLLNTLFPKLQLEVGNTSIKTERGRHTTKQVRLFPMADLFQNTDCRGFLADTPGFSLLDFENFDFFSLEDLPHTFLEFQPYLLHCKYKKCTHTKEEGCAILEEIKRGNLSKSRHESYLQLYEILKNKKNWKTKKNY